ncbi:MAG: dihydropteroate synthase [Roseivirga sp.]|nr:dihydropteroate synthase [Roseivirga sp.]
MGILNVTPDSFYAVSRHQQKTALLRKAEEMLSHGATILDIGGYSSRPGAEHISEEEETKRVTEAIDAITSSFPEAYISIDTFRAGVAHKSVESGACIINDISGGNLDERMFAIVAQLGVPYILMHMQGTPQNMIRQTDYDDLITDIYSYFSKKVGQLTGLGVSDIILDPGFGFSKTREQSYEVLRNLGYFKSMKLPLLAGISRKSMIYKELGIGAESALNGTTALNIIALTNGASLLRVHDVQPAMEAIRLFKATYP